MTSCRLSADAVADLRQRTGALDREIVDIVTLVADGGEALVILDRLADVIAHARELAHDVMLEALPSCVANGGRDPATLRDVVQVIALGARASRPLEAG